MSVDQVGANLCAVADIAAFVAGIAVSVDQVGANLCALTERLKQLETEKCPSIRLVPTSAP